MHSNESFPYLRFYTQYLFIFPFAITREEQKTINFQQSLYCLRRLCVTSLEQKVEAQHSLSGTPPRLQEHSLQTAGCRHPAEGKSTRSENCHKSVLEITVHSGCRVARATTAMDFFFSCFSEGKSSDVVGLEPGCRLQPESRGNAFPLRNSLRCYRCPYCLQPRQGSAVPQCRGPGCRPSSGDAPGQPPRDITA